MIKKNLVSLIFVFISIGLISCGEDGSDNGKEDISYREEGKLAYLNGDYTSKCEFDDGISVVSKLNIKDSKVKIVETTHYGLGCKEENIVEKIEGIYLLDISGEYKGETLIKERLESIKVSVYDSYYANYLNSVEDSGYKDWTVEEEKNITQDFLLKSKEDESYTEYYTIKLDGNTLYMNGYRLKLGDNNPSVDDSDTTDIYYKAGSEPVEPQEPFETVDLSGTFETECMAEADRYRVQRAEFTNSTIITKNTYYHTSCDEENKLYQVVGILKYTQIGQFGEYNIIEETGSSYKATVYNESQLENWKSVTEKDGWEIGVEKDISSVMNLRQIAYDIVKIIGNKLYINDFDPKTQSVYRDDMELIRVE